MTRFEFLKKEFVGGNKLTEETLMSIIEADPTTFIKKNDEGVMDLEKIKVGMFSQWIIKNYLAIDPDNKMLRDRFIEDLYKVKEDLTKFKRFKTKLSNEERDINKHTTESLYFSVANFNLLEASTTKSERTSTFYHPGAEIYYEDDKWLVMEISDTGEMGKEAAVYYGGNNIETRWCTSAPGGSYYNTYLKDGPLYVIMDKTDTNLGQQTGLPMERYQLHFETKQFMDKHDHSFDIYEFFNDKEEMKDTFKINFYTSFLKSDSKTVEVLSGDSNLGKVVKMYGLNDLYEYLDDKIETIKIQGINVHEDLKGFDPTGEHLYKFVNLKMLVLIDCGITEIGCDLTKFKHLFYIDLSSNRKLKNIGCEVTELQDIKQLNLTDTSVPVYHQYEEVEITPNNYDFQLAGELGPGIIKDMKVYEAFV